MSYSFDNEFVQCTIYVEDDLDAKIKLKGNVKQMASAKDVIISAPKPIDRMTTYTGSGLPFPCAQMAFENTPNFAKLTEPTGAFDLKFSFPNGYYTRDACTKIEPSVFVTFYWKDTTREKTVVRLPLFDRQPMRTLSYRPNYYKGPQYYAAKSDIIGIRGAEATMRALAEAKVQYDIA
jgi:hypothetical protein